MRILRKILFLSVIVTLISSSFPFHMIAAEQSIDHYDKELDVKATIISDEDNEDVYLFESNSVTSDVLMTLDDSLIVTVIEQNEEFTYILVDIEDEDQSTLLGYVLNEHIELIDEEQANDEAASEDESLTDDAVENEDTLVEDDVKKDEAEDSKTSLNEDEEKDDEQDTVNINLTSLNDTALNGMALKSPTYVYAEQSTSSPKIRSYSKGTILKYYELNNNWYRATVKYKGEWTTGYIHKSDVDTIPNDDHVLQGIALKNPTNVYESASTSSKAIRQYDEGSILKYRSYTGDWYIARVKYQGEWTTGYIHKSDVENITGVENHLEGIAIKNPTNVYDKASKNSKAIRQYSEGSILKYRTFSSDWYVARVKYNNKWTTGYIHKSDVENAIEHGQSLSGIGLKQPTNIYTKASTSAKVHKTYQQGSLLKYKQYTSSWYEAVVFVSGKRKIGYIHKSDVEQIVDKQEQVEGWALKTPTNVYAKASRNSKILRNDYKKGKKLKLKTLSKNWYEATVKYNNKWTTGYIHARDISLVNATYTDYNLSLKDAVDIQLKGAPQTDKKYAWVSKSYIKNNKVTADELNVRLGPGTNYKSVDKIKKNTEVKILDEYNGWYTIEFNHNSQWTHASPKDVMSHLDPQNFINDERQKFQFLDLSKASGASTSVLNKFLQGKGTLSGQGKAFIDASAKHGVNDIYLLSHAILETGHGSSRLAQGLKVGLDKNNKPQLVTSKNEKNLTNIKTVYNMFGVRAFDSCPDSCGATYAYEQGWDTPYKAIVGGAEFISSDYIQGKNNEGTVLNTLYKMRWNPEFASKNNRYGKQYATDIGWAVKQVNTMYNLYEQIGEYQLVFDIPVYLK